MFERRSDHLFLLRSGGKVRDGPHRLSARRFVVA